MTAFIHKNVAASVTLGERLRSVREEARWTLDEASSRSGIRAAYLAAIEEGRYGDLPGAVYARNFVRRYAKILEVSEAAVLEMFDREHAVSKRIDPSPHDRIARSVHVREIITPQRIRWGIIVLLGIAILVYLGLELRNFTAPPMLVIDYPPEQLTTESRSVELRGSTNPEVTVTVNGKSILVDRNGVFRESLDLQDGLNTVIIRAQKKRGNAATVVRSILVNQSTNN